MMTYLHIANVFHLDTLNIEYELANLNEKNFKIITNYLREKTNKLLEILEKNGIPLYNKGDRDSVIIGSQFILVLIH